MIEEAREREKFQRERTLLIHTYASFHHCLFEDSREGLSVIRVR